MTKECALLAALQTFAAWILFSHFIWWEFSAFQREISQNNRNFFHCRGVRWQRNESIVLFIYLFFFTLVWLFTIADISSSYFLWKCHCSVTISPENIKCLRLYGRITGNCKKKTTQFLPFIISPQFLQSFHLVCLIFFFLENFAFLCRNHIDAENIFTLRKWFLNSFRISVANYFSSQIVNHNGEMLTDEKYMYPINLNVGLLIAFFWLFQIEFLNSFETSQQFYPLCIT